MSDAYVPPRLLAALKPGVRVQANPRAIMECPIDHISRDGICVEGIIVGVDNAPNGHNYVIRISDGYVRAAACEIIPIEEPRDG